jgi:hypothetical protein
LALQTVVLSATNTAAGHSIIFYMRNDVWGDVNEPHFAMQLAL